MAGYVTKLFKIEEYKTLLNKIEINETKFTNSHVKFELVTLI